MRTLHRPVVIFSLERTDYGREQWTDFLRWNAELGHIKPVIGSYKGQKENSWIISAARFYSSDQVPDWVNACHFDGQESVLFLDGQRGAWLRFAPRYDESDQVYLGQWRRVTEAEALKREAWTFDPAFGNYYIAG